jgi:hypothetical protein
MGVVQSARVDETPEQITHLRTVLGLIECGASPAARWANPRARFSPACLRPVKNSALRRPCQVETIPEVNHPVRSRELAGSSSTPAECGLARAGARIFIAVSSL